MQLYFSGRFDRAFHKLTRKDKGLVDRVTKILDLLRKNPFHPSLKLHKLEGTDEYSVSVNYNLRLIFKWEDSNIYITNIGSHEEVY